MNISGTIAHVWEIHCTHKWSSDKLLSYPWQHLLIWLNFLKLFLLSRFICCHDNDHYIDVQSKRPNSLTFLQVVSCAWCIFLTAPYMYKAEALFCVSNEGCDLLRKDTANKPLPFLVTLLVVSFCVGIFQDHLLWEVQVCVCVGGWVTAVVISDMLYQSCWDSISSYGSGGYQMTSQHAHSLNVFWA